MGSLSKFCPAVQDILNFSAPKKEFFRRALKGTYIHRMTPQRVFLLVFFKLPGNKHLRLHFEWQNHSNFVNRGLFCENFMKHNMKKINSRTVTPGVGGLEISFWHCHKSRTIASTFIKKTSFCPQLYVKCNKIMKS